MKNNKFQITANTFKAVANCKKYSRNVSILKWLLGVNILGVGAIVGCVAIGVIIPYSLGVIVASLIGCVTEFSLLSYNHYNEKVTTRLKERFATEVQKDLFDRGVLVDSATFKLQRFSPIDDRKSLSMSANVGNESSSEEKTVSCNEMVGSYTETYRVSHIDNKTLGFYDVSTVVEPYTELTSGARTCTQVVKASSPKYSFKFIPKGDEILSKQHKFELECYEKGKSPIVEGSRVSAKRMFRSKR